MAFENFKKITLNDMIDYIEKNGTDTDKKEFKIHAYSDKDGNPLEKYNHLNAVRWFCTKYMPDIVPKRKEVKEKVSNRIANW